MSTKFAYYQDLGNGGFYPVFKMTDHLGNENDLGRDDLESMGEAVPDYPGLKTWREEVFSRRRCGHCYAPLSGTLPDLAEHVEDRHPVLLLLRRKVFETSSDLVRLAVRP